MSKITHLMSIECGIPVVCVERGMKLTEAEKKVSFLEIPSSDSLGLSGSFKFKYTYPLSHTAIFEHELTPELSAMDILLIARADYERIYKEEDESGLIVQASGFLLNRGASNGKHGIWGHVIDDLVFEGIEVRGRNVSFYMGS